MRIQNTTPRPAFTCRARGDRRFIFSLHSRSADRIKYLLQRAGVGMTSVGVRPREIASLGVAKPYPLLDARSPRACARCELRTRTR